MFVKQLACVNCSQVLKKERRRRNSDDSDVEQSGEEEEMDKDGTAETRKRR